LIRLVGLVLAFALSVGIGYIGYNTFASQRTATASQIPRYQTVVVQRGNIAATVSATGQLVPINQAKLAFGTSGQLIELNVKVGDVVKAGDVLAKLDYRDEEYQLAQQAINLENARIKLEQAKAGPSSQDVTIAKVNLDKAALNLAKAQSDYDKIAWRKDVGMTPQAAALQQATLDYQAALAQYAKATAGSTDQDIQILVNNVKAAEASYNLAKLNLEKNILIAPFDGTVAQINGNLNENVSASPFIFLVDTENLRLEANVDETDVAKIQVGQDATITLDALPGLQLRGKVTAIAPTSTLQSGVVTYLIHVTLTDKNPRLRPGMTATASILVDQRTGVLYVPNRAIRVQRNMRTIQVLENGAVVEKQIRTGLSNEQFTEVVEGLKEGEQVVMTITPTTQPMGAGGFNFGAIMGRR